MPSAPPVWITVLEDLLVTDARLRHAPRPAPTSMARRPARPSRVAAAARALALATVASAAPAVPLAFAAEPDATAPAAPGTASILYQEAMAHADDVIDFDAGLPAGEADAPSDLAGGSGTPAGVGTTTAADLQAVSGPRLRREVFGFLPYWQLASSAGRIDLDVLTTVAYFSVGADRNGNILTRNADGSAAVGWAGWRSERMTRFIERAHRAGTRVVLTLSVFAWTTGQATTQRAILGSPARRARLARQLATEVHARGVDGVNLDVEPLVRGMEGEYVAFVRTLRRELDRRGRGYQLTLDTMGSIGNYPIERLTGRGAADAVFVMGYDYRGGRSERAGSIDPLAGARYDLGDTVRAYTSRIPASRVILGLPWYGRAWSTIAEGVRAANQSGAQYGPSVAVPYDAAAAFARAYGRLWDPREQTSWVRYRKETCTAAYGCRTSWRQLYFSDAASLRLRYDLVNRYGLRGAGIWALGYEGARRELYADLGAKFADAASNAKITLNSHTISPDGDGQLDTAVLRLALQGGSVWQVRLRAADGTLLRHNVGTGSGGTLTWDGRRPDGRGVADGRFRYEIAIRDARGRTTSRTIALAVDRAAPAITAAVDVPSFSPDGDGTNDRAVLRWATDERAVGAVRLLHAGRPVRGWSVAAGTGGTIALDGRDGHGRPLRDGRYVLQVTLRDAARNERTVSVPVALDRTAGSLRWSGSFFPQDDDAIAVEGTIRFHLARTATVTLRIEDPGGRVVRNVYLDRTLRAGDRSWAWDGRTGNGSWAPQGRYRAVLIATSALGTMTLTRDVYAAAYRTTVPASVTAGEVLEVVFDSLEPLSTVPVVILSRPNREPVSLRAKPTGDGRWRAAFRTHPGEEGEAGLRISARDERGRWNTEVLAVTIGS